jgi:adenylyl-sulfate kinase
MPTAKERENFRMPNLEDYPQIRYPFINLYLFGRKIKVEGFMKMHKGFTLWFTGLSGSGKSTLTELLDEEFEKRGYKVEVLDGDIVRTNLSKGLGFSKEDRDTNIRRIGFVCDLLSRNGVIAISAAISPYQSVRDENRKLVESHSVRFVEVYVKCSLDELVRRDVKGLYKKAIAGEIKNFTGVSDPYEGPENPEILLDSEAQSVEESLAQILDYLEKEELIGSPVAAEKVLS